jgi:hypothetical protein
MSVESTKAPDQPFKFDPWAEIVALPNDRLRIRMSNGLVLPWIPAGAVLERVKTNSIN